MQQFLKSHTYTECLRFYGESEIPIVLTKSQEIKLQKLMRRWSKSAREWAMRYMTTHTAEHLRKTIANIKVWENLKAKS